MHRNHPLPTELIEAETPDQVPLVVVAVTADKSNVPVDWPVELSLKYKTTVFAFTLFLTKTLSV